MAWNPSPEVAAARDFGKQFNANRVIVIYTTPDGHFSYASYGADKALCAEAKIIADKLFDTTSEILEDVL